jgi:hypothetical protein
LSVVGGEVAIPAFTEHARRELVCDTLTTVLTDFAPGKGEVEIAVINQDLTTQVVGGFEFNVHRLYDGAFSFGAVRSSLLNPSFSLTPDSLITIAEDGEATNHRVLLAVFYTPFIWGRRDLEKPPDMFDYRSFNPSIGLVLNDVSENFLAGVSWDIHSSLYVTVGAHLGRVRTLDPNATASDGSRLQVGDRFSGAPESIPTVTNWDTDWFVSLALDLRAAVGLIRKVLAPSS